MLNNARFMCRYTLEEMFRYRTARNFSRAFLDTRPSDYGIHFRAKIRFRYHLDSCVLITYEDTLILRVARVSESELTNGKLCQRVLAHLRNDQVVHRPLPRIVRFHVPHVEIIKGHLV